ncbi:MAG: hypothetical protein VX899_27090 [Myxococcota bacterium]|nr:hypothetical protein [Myxococcota bacterium]
MLLLLTACLAAVHPIPGTQPQQLLGQVAFELPQDWEVVVNNRAFGNHHVLLRSPPAQQAVVTIDLVREGRRTRELDLRIVAETYALDRGRSLDIEAKLLAHHQLEVADREAWAVTVQRRHGPNEQLASTVALRGSEHLALLTLSTPLEAGVAAAVPWGQILDSFALPGDPVDPNAPIFPRDAELENELDGLPSGGL